MESNRIVDRLPGVNGDRESGLTGKRNTTLRRHRTPGWVGGSFAGWQPRRVLEVEHQLERMAIA